MSSRVTVAVLAHDPVSQEGVSGQLRRCSDVLVDDGADAVTTADVVVVVADELDTDGLDLVRRVAREKRNALVLVVGRVDDSTVVAAAEAGATALLRRREATVEQLGAAVTGAAAGKGTLAPDLLARLLSRVGHLRHDAQSARGRDPLSLVDREIDVLRLVADGYDTAEIAATLCYSERTVKSVLHDVTARLNLRNRTHAVAFAVRQGLI